MKPCSPSARRGSIAFGLLLVLSLTGCDGNYLMHRLERNEGEGWIDMGDGCQLVQRGDGESGGGFIPDEDPGPDTFGFETTSKGAKAHVTITTSEGIVELEFDQAFLRSDEEVVTEVQTGAGTLYRVTHWGDEECNVRSEEEWAAGGATAE